VIATSTLPGGICELAGRSLSTRTTFGRRLFASRSVICFAYMPSRSCSAIGGFCAYTLPFGPTATDSTSVT
jgi:hypothetical protein